MPLDKQKLDTTLPNSGIDSFQTAKDFFLFEVDISIMCFKIIKYSNLEEENWLKRKYYEAVFFIFEFANH